VKISVAKGDGIGPEIIDAVLAALKTANTASIISGPIPSPLATDIFTLLIYCKY
jgi:hypothetical protein